MRFGTGGRHSRPHRTTTKAVAALAGATAITLLGATAAFAAGSLNSDLQAGVNGIQKTIDLGTLPAATGESQNVDLWFSGTDASASWSVTGDETSGVDAHMDAITVTGDGTHSTGVINWTTPAAPSNTTQYSTVVHFTADPEGPNTNGADVTITFSLTGTGGSSGPCTGKPTAADVTIVESNPSSVDGTNGWWITAPTLSATGANGSVEWDDNAAFSSPSASAPSLTEGTTEVYARDVVTGTDGSVCSTSATAAHNTYNVDLNNPSLNITGAADGTSYDLCTDGVPTRPTFSPSDTSAGSGIDSDVTKTFDTWTPSSIASGVGTYAYSAQAYDLASRHTSESRTYSVTYGSAFSGVLQPINQDGSSRFKLGSTIPVKFKLTCGTTPIDDAHAWLTVKKADGSADPGVDEAISTSQATEGNAFRYDANAGQYIFNLSTKRGYTNPDGTTITSYAAGSWVFTITLDDGSTHNIGARVQVQMVK
jgi:hypothetical protein